MQANLLAEPVEPRLLYAADFAPALLATPALSETWDSTETQLVQHHRSSAEATQAVGERRIELIVIDATVADAGSLLADLQAQRDAGRNISWLQLSGSEDGINRIGHALQDLQAQGQTVSALHLLGHGADGITQLGASRLDSTSLALRAGDIAAWGASFATGADVLLYGCDVAAGSAGAQLVADLATLTGADVAASSDTTGSSLRGGNWTLEVASGSIEASSAISASAQQQWGGVLASFTVTRFDDANTAGTLRWAITQANNAAGADTILLSAGTYTLSLGWAAGTGNVGADLDVSGQLSISGAGAGQTIIKSLGDFRHFEVVAGAQLSLSGVTLRGGDATTGLANGDHNDGGAIYVNTGATLNLSQSVLEGNKAERGGAIFSTGTVNLTDTELRNNRANEDGGGLYDSGTAQLTRTTVSNNLATEDGAGIYKTSIGTLAINNSTISGNQAGANGGGIYTNASVSITSSTLAFNQANGSAGGVFISSGSVAVSARSSLFANNTSDGSSHANRNFSSLGNNLVTGSATGLTNTSDKTVSNANIAALANNGGFTATHALLVGSEAINSGAASAPTTDQRGMARYGAPDIGAYELQNSAPVITRNELIISAGGIGLLSVSASDAQGDAITYHVVSANNGYFVLSSAPTSAITSFSALDAASQLVRFVHTGGAAAPSYSLRAADSANPGVAVAGSVQFTPPNSAPTVTAVNLGTVLEDGSLAINAAALLAGATDANGDPLGVLSLAVVGSNATLAASGGTGLAGAGLGQGLNAEYFANSLLSGAPVLTRTESPDFDWLRGSPGPGLGIDLFSVRWTGFVVPAVSGTYTLRTQSDDGIRLWVDNVLVVDNWSTHAVQENNVSLNLTAGQAHSIKLEYFEAFANATARLLWKQPGSTNFTPIPTARLFDSAPPAPTTWVLSPNANTHGNVDLTYTVSDGNGGSVSNTARVVVLPVNDAPTVTTNTLSITEGATATPLIVAADVDHTAEQITWLSSNVSGGMFVLASAPSTAITSFTQAQLNAAQVKFVHDGSNAAPSYTLRARDAAGALSAPSSVSVSFTATNDAPVVQSNHLSVSQGGVTSISIRATDEESSAAQLSWTVLYQTEGYFAFTSAPGTAITSFTQEDLNNQLVQFVYTGVLNPPAYGLMVSDGSTTTSSVGSVAFDLTNTAPSFVANSLAIVEGGSAAPVIGSTDPNHSEAQRLITVSGVLGGQFELSTAMGVAITSFTQAQASAALVLFVHDGSNTAPRYTLTIADPLGAQTVANGAVSFTATNDAPVLLSNSLVIAEGGSATLDVQVSDEESTNAALLINAYSVAGGQFELRSAPGVAISQFTPAQVDADAVVFVHNGQEAAPSYSLTVSEILYPGLHSVHSSALGNIVFTSVNDTPQLLHNRLSITEGLRAVPDLQVSDAESPASALTYTVNSISGGYFELAQNRGGAITQFTQADVDAQNLFFVHDGSSAAPNYSLSLIDADGASINLGPVSVVFTPVNDAPVFSASSLVITEGGNAVPVLNISDEDDNTSQLTLVVQSTARGQFEWVATPGVVTTSFTQAQLDAGEVHFVHDGSNQAPSYTLKVVDSANAYAMRAGDTSGFTALNDTPDFSVSDISVSAGGSAVLAATGSDEESSAEQLSLSVRNMLGGHFELRTDPGVARTSFSLADAQNGDAVFVHDGSSTVGQFSLDLSDGQNTVSLQVQVQVVQPPPPPPPAPEPAPAPDPAPAPESAPAPSPVPAPAPTRAPSAALISVQPTPVAPALPPAPQSVPQPAPAPNTSSAAASPVTSPVLSDIPAVPPNRASVDDAASAATARAADIGNAAVAAAVASAVASPSAAAVNFGNTSTSSTAKREGSTAAEGATSAASVAPAAAVAASTDANNPLWAAGAATAWEPLSAAALAQERSVLDLALGLTRSEGLGARSNPMDQAAAKVRDDIDEGRQAEQTALAGGVAISTGLSLGYVVWLARGGVLLASLASSLPAWAMVDPLPVLSRFKAKGAAGEADAPDPEANEPGAETQAEASPADAEDPGMSRNRNDPLERLFSKGRASAAAAVPAPPPTTSAKALESNEAL